MISEDQQIIEYCQNHSTLPSKFCFEIATETRQNHPLARMLCGELEASFLGFIIGLTNATKVLEIGTFTGYSALAMAECLPEEGVVITVDKNKKINEFASSMWKKSPHGQKIRALFGEGLKVIPTLEDKFDLIFIDADKKNYKNYFVESLRLLSENGLIIVDNVLWSGKVLYKPEDETTSSIIEFNDFVKNFEGIYITMLPIRDGIFLIRKTK
ncbi:MAG: class I SAM-dependent methyltransferase [Halobacteriovoraceae bacterium]|nr:class I SAM-dependent methyltransferase [Halobacteriovoraceae bacterium]